MPSCRFIPSRRSSAGECLLLDSKPVSIGSILLLDGLTVVLLETDRGSEVIVRLLLPNIPIPDRLSRLVCCANSGILELRFTFCELRRCPVPGPEQVSWWVWRPPDRLFCRTRHLKLSGYATYFAKIINAQIYFQNFFRPRKTWDSSPRAALGAKRPSS